MKTENRIQDESLKEPGEARPSEAISSAVKALLRDASYLSEHAARVKERRRVNGPDYKGGSLDGIAVMRPSY